MKDTSPVVTIGMPVRNNRSTLAIALQSIIEQSYKKWELLLIDDGSDDGTPEVARSFASADPRIRFFCDGRARGLPDRLNEAIEMARGSIFARMDGDDVSYPERLDRQVAYLDAHPDVDLVGTGAIVFGDGGLAFGKRVGAEQHEAICARPTSGFPIIHPTFMGRIEYFRHFRYSVSAQRSEDQELLIRSYESGSGIPLRPMPRAQDQALLMRSYRGARFANLPEILLGYRECRLDLAKISSSRRYLARFMLDEFRRQGRPMMAIRALIEQSIKEMVDRFAIGTGLNYRLLRHRARAASVVELDRWRHIWSDLNDRTIEA